MEARDGTAPSSRVRKNDDKLQSHFSINNKSLIGLHNCRPLRKWNVVVCLLVIIIYINH